MSQPTAKRDRPHRATFWKIACLLVTYLCVYLVWDNYLKAAWQDPRNRPKTYGYIGEDNHGNEILEFSDEPMAKERVDFKAAEATVFSQHGEDGVVAKVFEHIEPTSRFCVEFGGGDGVQFSNVRNLIVNHGWGCLLIEGDEEKSAASATNYAAYPNVKSVHKWVYPGNLETIFEDNGVPVDLDFLVIDIDSNDYWCWKALHKYRPKLVMIECNGLWAPPAKVVVEYNPFNYWDGGQFFGASLQALYELGKEKGYELVYMNSYGVNAFFVDKKYFARFGIRDNRPSRLYVPHMGSYSVPPEIILQGFDETGRFVETPAIEGWDRNLKPLHWDEMTVEKVMRVEIPGAW
jgi:hypothetical protein